ncbi:MAG TPA: ATPase [Micrococcales bacterium]|uniref:HAD-IC family P-type ATPase n=1 Tax=Miniimonas arenae TaxID=676201 RepID=UPI000EC4E98D|nr:HAD-IC family P-type ATPase [Miniimonas arenae]HCX83631.1 ATPase [Micrococcales bacterium]
MTTATLVGLTEAEVAQRVAAGQVNRADDATSRSLADILRANTLTLFNAMLGAAFVLVLLTGRWQDALFGLVLVVNTLVGVVTEYRAKRTLDQLAVLDAPTARALRDGQVREVAVGHVVLDDVLEIAAGDQVPVDAEVLQTRGLELDESLLTGESRPVRRGTGEEVLSGSSVVAGAATVRAVRVGADSYAQKVTAAAKRYSLASSELQAGVRRVLRVVSWIIVPMAVLLGLSQLRALGGWDAALANGTWRDAVVQSVAGVVGMIPDGLVLLVSLNFALAAVLLARQNVLVQELPAVEVLARVDVLCLDKTGTITDGAVACEALLVLDADGEPTSAQPDRRVLAVLAAIGAQPGANATAAALAEHVRSRAGTAPGAASGASTTGSAIVPAAVGASVPFSSARKWSALDADGEAWVLGAPEVVLAGREDALARATLAAARERAGAGARVVLLSRAPEGLPDVDEAMPAVVPAALAVLAERVRGDASATLGYFREQDVALHVISGDNADTVGAIATKVELLGPGVDVPGTDARTLPDDVAALGDALQDAPVLGRVTPEQKVGIVEALQAQGRTVAMTGDGVNDALAIKTADLGIAMGEGARATKAVSRIVLLDGRFATLPGVLAQGRRVIANMERVATFFLVKTAYSTVLAVVTVLATLAVPIGYPFLPRHLTLVSALTIGIPGFLLSLPPSQERYVPGFLRRVLSFALPAGLLVAVAAMGVYLATRDPAHDGETTARTLATLSATGLGLVIVVAYQGRFAWWKAAMVAVLAAAGVGAPYVPLARDFFLLEVPTAADWLLVLAVVAVGGALLVLLRRVVQARDGGHAGRAGSPSVGPTT